MLKGTNLVLCMDTLIGITTIQKGMIIMDTKYVITGVERNGKRFKPIYTNTPQHYNIWSGTLWKLENGKRKKVKEYYN